VDTLIEKSPAGIQERLEAVKPPGETVLIQVSADMASLSAFGEQWVIATRERVFVIPAHGRNGTVEVPVADLSEVSTEELVGAGCLTLDRVDNAPVRVAYSNSLKAKFAEVASGLQRLKKSETPVFPDEIEKTRCDACGRLLPEKDGICPACIKKWDTLKRIARYLGPYKKQVAIQMALSVIAPALALVPPQIVRFIVDDVLTPRDNLGLLFLLIAAYLGVQVANWGVEVGQGWVRGGLSSRTARDVRGQLYRHIQVMPVKFFDKRQVGTLMSRFTNDADRLEMLLLFGIPEMLTNSLQLIGILALLFYMNWQLTLFILLPVPFILLGSYLIWGRMRGLWTRWHGRWSRLNMHLNESISGIRVVKAFAQEDRELSRFSRHNEGLREVSVTADRNWFLFFTVMNFLMGFGVFFVWYFGGRQIIEGTLTLGILMAFISYLWQLYHPLTWMNQLSNFVTRAFAAAERIFEILDTQPETAREETLTPMPVMKGEVEFKDVHFEYEKGKSVLKGVNLKVAPGEMIGLVGKSGVGKSTLIRLICRFYDPDQGSLTIDGVDIRNIPLDDLRGNIGLVQQEPFLFNGTVAENIAYSRPDAEFRDVVRAAMAAEAHEFIVRKPDGYNMVVGEQGGRLSRGEKQRIAIARAILHDPKILILDEATSSLDTPTEKKIQLAVGRLVEGRTTFAIAHRLSTLRRANRLVVMDDGKVAEVGSHEELMEKEGLFHRLVKTQRETTSVVGVGGGKDDPNSPVDEERP
jgi:ATP-binding cassette, subfamily B, bacterial